MFNLDQLFNKLRSLGSKRAKDHTMDRPSHYKKFLAKNQWYKIEYALRMMVSALLCLCFGLGLGLSLAFATTAHAKALYYQQDSSTLTPINGQGSMQSTQGAYQPDLQQLNLASTTPQGWPDNRPQLNYTTPMQGTGYLGSEGAYTRPNGYNPYGQAQQMNGAPVQPYAAQGMVYYPTPVQSGSMPTNLGTGNIPDAFPLSTTLDETDLAILKELSKAKNSKSTKLQSKPFISKPGEVTFIYGASQPTIVCSLLHVCDIALEPGENVVDIKIGDSTRWIIERSASGSYQGIIEHITLKPTDVNLQSNLRIYTDRRSYSLNLKSSSQDFMPNITFVYPEQSLAKYAQIKNQLQQQQLAQERNTIHMGKQALPLTALNFNYEIEGDKTIKPLRVFNDQHKTYIQMSPQLMRQNRLPALVAVHEEGGFFSDDKTAVINYRVIDNNFVVDGIPPHLRLILGQSSDQTASVDIKLQLD